MFSQYLSRFTTLFCAALLLASGGVRADDTEIYFQPTSDLGADPMVYFYIEYTPNMGSTVCAGVTVATIDTTCAAVAPIKTYLAANDLSATDSVIDQFELTRAALKRVLIGLGEIKVGLLMAHNDLTTCAGGPSADGATCSQGGYILKGLTLIDTPTTGFNPKTATAAQLTAELALQPGKKALFDKLDALRSPQGGFNHPNQNKEIYFELFRHLTGQGIYNGHNGGADFNTAKNDNRTGAFNLGALSTVTPANYRYNCATGFTCDTTLGTGQYVYSGNSNGKINGDMAPIDSTNYISTKAFVWDSTIEDGSDYRAALTNDCAKVFVVNVLDGGGFVADKADTAIKATLSSGGMNFPVSNGDTGFTEMVRWLHDKDLADGSINDLNLLDRQNVTSFFIAKHPQQADAFAQAGGTGYAIPLGTDAQSVVDAINNIFQQILSISTTFVSASIPVNVFNRSEVIDNAYIALFQANDKAQPRWVGNVKKLKLDIYIQCAITDPVTGKCLKSESRLRLVDSLGNNAVSSIDGRIQADSLTFWTQANGYDLSDNIDPAIEVAGRDGRAVHRGGAGQRIPNMLLATGTPGVMNWLNSANNRRLYTEAAPYAASGTGLLDIHWSNMASLWPSIYDASSPATVYDLTQFWPTTYVSAGVKKALTGVWSSDISIYTQDPGVTLSGSQTSFYTGDSGYSTTYSNQYFQIYDLSSNVLAFMRGFDVKDEDKDTITWESRRWTMGDPLHSRPLPINYGARPGSGYTTDNPDIRIITGSDDGYMRMIRNTNPDASESGQEVWAFMPRQVMKIQKQLMDNAAGKTPIHPYGVDGPPTAYVKDSDGNIDPAQGDKVWLYFGLRRGGKAYYGLDVTDPDNPKFLWKIDPSTTGFSELGYSFAQPIMRELDWGSGRRPVLIIGGGYDTNKDNITQIGSNDTIGTAVYVIDAETGALVWKATRSGTAGLTTFVNTDMLDSIPSEVTAVDGTGDGLVDRFYVGDTGGRVWRMDLPGSDRSKWKATKLLDLGRHVTNDWLNDRRFFTAADVVPSRDTTGYFDAVVIGSGNREHPLGTTTRDHMYMFKDRAITSPLAADYTALTPAGLADITDNCVQELGITCTIPPFDVGWKLWLTEGGDASGDNGGEKSLASALTLRGVIYFSTYLPATAAAGATSCGPNEGSGFLYAIALQDGRAVFNYDTTNTVKDANGKDVDLQIEDRKRRLLSGGIPSENVYISYRDKDGNTFSGILASDLQAGNDLGAQQWNTYWFEKQK